MSSFTFKRGIWSEGAGVLEINEEEDFSDYLKRIKYSVTKFTFGEEEEGSLIEIHESEESGAFLACVTLGEKWYLVAIPDFPSVMMFIRDFGTPFATEASNFSQRESLRIQEKLFHAEHGHYSYLACDKCDPRAAEQERKFSAARRAEKAPAG